MADENWLDDEGECDTAEARESPTYTSTSKKCSYAIFIISESIKIVSLNQRSFFYKFLLPDDMAMNVCKNVDPIDIPPPLFSYIASMLGLKNSILIIDDTSPISFFLLNNNVS